MESLKQFDHSFFKKTISLNVKPVTKIPNSQILTVSIAGSFTHVCTFTRPKIPADVRHGNEKVQVENVFLFHLNF